MATQDGIIAFVGELGRQGLLTERKGAPDLTAKGAKAALLRSWHALMFDVTDAELAAGLVAYLRDPSCCEWYPQAGKILAHVPGRKAAGIDRTDELWGLVLAEVGRVGSWGVPAWPEADREALEAGVTALGGWAHLCSTLTAENATAERASFRAAVRGVLERGRARLEDSKALQLTGGAQPRLEVGGG